MAAIEKALQASGSKVKLALVVFRTLPSPSLPTGADVRGGPEGVRAGDPGYPRQMILPLVN